MKKIDKIWNIPNVITLLRIFLILPFLAFLFQNAWTAKLIALGIFILTAFSDWIDGVLARKLNQKTKFGNFMDPLADKLLVAASLIALPSLERDIFPFWMVFLILSREFIITYLRVFALSKNKEVQTMKLGKTKTTMQLLSIVVIIILLIIKAFLIQTNRLAPAPGPVGIPIAQIWKNYFSSWAKVLIYTPFFLMSITTIITVFSGVQYIYKNRSLFLGLNHNNHD